MPKDPDIDKLADEIAKKLAPVIKARFQRGFNCEAMTFSCTGDYVCQGVHDCKFSFVGHDCISPFNCDSSGYTCEGPGMYRCRDFRCTGHAFNCPSNFVG